MAKEGVMVRGWLCVTVAGGARIDLDDPGDRALLADMLTRNAAATVLPPIRYTEEAEQCSKRQIKSV